MRVTSKILLEGEPPNMKKLLTLLSVLVVAVSLSMPAFAQEAGTQEAPAKTAKHHVKHAKHTKTHAKKHKKSKKEKKEMKQQTPEGQNQ